MSLAAVAASAVGLLGIIGGLIWALVRSSRKNGLQDGEITELHGRIKWYREALALQTGPDPSLNDLLGMLAPPTDPAP